MTRSVLVPPIREPQLRSSSLPRTLTRTRSSTRSALPIIQNECVLSKHSVSPHTMYLCVRPTGTYRSQILIQFRSTLCTYNPSLFLLIRDLGTRSYLEHPLALEMVTADRFLPLIHASGCSTSDIQVKEGYIMSRLYVETHGS